MDPVSIFNALYDTKCLKFGQYDLKSGLVAPYYMNLRRLPLYPELMDAVVGEVVNKFLSSEALLESGSLLKSASEEAAKCGSASPASSESEADSQLDEEAAETSSQDSDWERIGGQSGHSTPLRPILCGVPYGAVPLAAAIAYRARLPYLLERKEGKSYGDQDSLMRDFNAETIAASVATTAGADKSVPDSRPSEESAQRVILIEDVICSGESILDAVRNLNRQKLQVEFVVCIVDREENGINLLLRDEGIRVLSLYNISAILRVLEATGRITNEQFVQTSQWIAANQFKSIGIDPTKKLANENIPSAIPLQLAD